MNDDWKIKPSILLSTNGVEVLTCKYHNGGEDKLTLFPPQSASDHILNAQQTDQLSPIVRISRITKQTQACKTQQNLQ